ALCAFERQGHLVGTVTGPPSGRPSQGSSLSILTGPHDELTPSHHSITSSARSRSIGKIVMPSALAVFRLTTSSNFDGCSIGRSAGEQRDELAPFHSITSSARASSDGGTSSASALAVLRLITSSNFVGS